MPMTPGDAGDVIPCEADPDYECVRLGSQSPASTVATPPDETPDTPGGLRLCPEGYVPRRRRRPYRLEGKVVRRDQPPTHNAT
jgi:hypothetical protein